MSVWSDLVERVRTVIFRSREERELDEEIAFHLEQEEIKHREAGLSPAEARRRARLDFGGGDRIKEEVRDARGTSWLDQIRQDLVYALRTLRKQPGFALVTIAILGLGIGANTATFTLIDALLLRSLPVSEPDRLVMVGNPARTSSLSEGAPRADLLSYPVFRDVADAARSVSGLYATGRAGRLDLLIADSAGRYPPMPEHPRGRFVSANYFSVLEVPAAAGRTFANDEDRAAGASPVIVISDDYWRRRFGAAPDVVGRSITVNGARLTIVGVTPPGFTGDIVGQPSEIWIPLGMQPVLMPNRAWLTDRNVSWLLLMGRLRPGISFAQAKGELTSLVERSLIEHSTSTDRIRSSLKEDPVRVGEGARGFSYYRRAFAPTLYLLAAAVGLVLLVVCANVANLMLARGAARSREMNVRLSLGAGRLRVIQQLVTEGMVLAVTGGLVGLLIAHWGSALLLRLAGGGSAPLPLVTALDFRVLGFAGGISLVTVLLFGVLPAIRTTRVDLAGALRTTARSIAGSSAPGRISLTKALVLGQVALSMVLLVGTGMVVRSMIRLGAADLGFERERLVIGSIDVARSGYSGPRLDALRRDFLERVGRIPGVQSVSLSENGVFSGTESGNHIAVEGFVARSSEDSAAAYDDVTPAYFTTLGVPVLLGRDFEPRDDEPGSAVAVINRTMAEFYWPKTSPIGRHFTADSTTYEIIGVVPDLKTQEVRQAQDRRFYLLMARIRDQPLAIKIEARARGRTAELVQPIRTALAAADPGVTVLSVEPLTDLVHDSISQDRMAAQVVALFGGLALLLAALGLYGLLAYATVRRTNEFGLRLALGAKASDVGRLVVVEALGLVAAGAIVGIPGAMGLARLFRQQWFGLPAIDWPSVALAVGVLLLAAGLAASIPALRASRIPPLQALRSD
jgi:predicted permease